MCDRFRDECGERPSVDTAAPDVRIHAYVTESEATLYLDTSGEPLYIRGFKYAKVGAPLKENLAAGILRLSGWQRHVSHGSGANVTQNRTGHAARICV